MTDPIRFSILKAMAKSPAHYRALRDTPFAPTASMRIGTITHRLVLGGDLVVYDGRRAGKAWDEFEAAHGGEEIFTASELEQAKPIAASVQRSDMAMHWLGGVQEQRIDWTFLGRTFRSTPDAYGVGRVADLKTTRCSEPGRFGRDAIGMHYHAQLACYGMALGLDVGDDHVIVAVERVAPYAVTVLRLTDRAVEAGRRLCHAWMERLLVCEASNEWPGYVQSMIDLDVPEELELDFGDAEEMEIL